MKRILVSLGLAICMTLQILPIANAAKKPDLVLKGFQSYVAIAKSTLTSVALKYNSDIAAIDAIQAASVQVAKSTFEKEILAAKTLYEPQINNAIVLLLGAMFAGVGCPTDNCMMSDRRECKPTLPPNKSYSIYDASRRLSGNARPPGRCCMMPIDAVKPPQTNAALSPALGVGHRPPTNIKNKI